MIKTLPLLTMPLLGATSSVVLAQSDSCSYRDRNEALLIRLLHKDVARLVVAAHQNAEWMTTTTADPATDRGCVPPDHLRVMTDRLVCRYIRSDRAAVIIVLFGDP
ncbi:MAG: hypothetical protein WBZ36_15315 [Candidatus Nitrosopolaris sp.]